jgi:uncharacterized membrane protein YebE (DUF533 family)
MNIQGLLNQFFGTPDSSSNTTTQGRQPGIGDMLSQFSNRLPEGFAGGAATGGIIALLIGSKTGRKLASKVVTYGGAALLGGMAYKAIKNWQQTNSASQDVDFTAKSQTQFSQDMTDSAETPQPVFELTLIKAMIAAAKADGHIDAEEQRRIFEAIQKMELSAEMKGLVFDLLQQDISVADIVNGVTDITHKSEVYLASYLVIDPDQMSERMHLDNLAEALDLPISLTKQLEAEAKQPMVYSGSRVW